MLKFVIGYDIDLQFDNYGRPYSRNFDLDFNYSHTSGLIVLAIASKTYCKIGIDTEKAERKNTLYEIENDAFSPNEMYVCKNDLVANWCLKEAAVKMFGMGFFYDDPKYVTIRANDSHFVLNLNSSSHLLSANYHVGRLNDYIIVVCTDCDDNFEIINYEEKICIS